MQCFFSCGNTDPGIVKRNVEMLNHIIAGINEGFTFFNIINFGNIRWKKASDYLFEDKNEKEPQKRPPFLTNYRTKIYYRVVL